MRSRKFRIQQTANPGNWESSKLRIQETQNPGNTESRKRRIQETENLENTESSKLSQETQNPASWESRNTRKLNWEPRKLSLENAWDFELWNRAGGGKCIFLRFREIWLGFYTIFSPTTRIVAHAHQVLLYWQTTYSTFQRTKISQEKVLLNWNIAAEMPTHVTASEMW